MSKVKRVEKFEKGTFMFICIDGEETHTLRSKHLFEHLDHIETHNDKYRLAGPMKANDEFVGSFFLVEADTEDEAWELMHGDPYISSNMYASITVNPFIPACGKLLGGVTWDQDEIRANIKKYA